jgi:hypothetical protein
LRIVLGFVQDIVDPSKTLATGGLPAWAPALLVSLLLFGAAALILRRRERRAVTAGLEPRANGLAGPAAAGTLLVAGCLVIGLGLVAAEGWPDITGAQGGWAEDQARTRALAVGFGIVGLLLISLASARIEHGASGTLRRIAYYGLWILVPLGIYMVTGTYASRGLYLPSVGVAGVIAGLLDGFGAALAGDRVAGAGPQTPIGWSCAGAAAFFWIGSMMLSSPPVNGLGEWPAKARLAGEFFAAFEREVAPQGPCPQIAILGLPDRGTIGLEEYSVQSWLRLRHPDWASEVSLEDRVPMTTIPTSFELRAGACTDGRLAATVELP